TTRAKFWRLIEVTKPVLKLFSALLAQLQVFIPSDVFVHEGEDAILPCRSITAGQWVKSVRWRRDGEVVLDVRSGKTTYGNGFDESRVSIPSDWDQRANLSLIIKRAEARDGGVYYCDIDKVEKHRSAVRLHVSTPPTPPSTTSRLTTTERPNTHKRMERAKKCYRLGLMSRFDKDWLDRKRV
uniref:Ig-like domain-containing protein n=1 Tax=Maylandia zebra TaxID=106582 RepID=A0A3P9CX87_9CICH